MMKIQIRREPTKKETTLGKLYIDGVYFCETLEDAIRDHKIDGQTAIPSGVYSVDITMSSRFKRLMPLVYNKPDKTVDNGVMRFAGIRIHGGNKHADTHGCPLVAFHRLNDTTIQGTAEAKLTAKIKAAIDKGEKVELEVLNP